jgi:hypothetical protein
MSAVTLGQIEEMVEALPLPDHERLIVRLNERLASRQEYFARAETFIKTCLESPVRPKSSTELDDLGLFDSGTEIAEMRDERGDQLL